VRKEGRVSFASFFEGEKRRARIVGVFLAILELLRHHGFRAEQPVDFEDIWVLPPVDEVSSE
jgi:segregation and condensation protein A